MSYLDEIGLGQLWQRVDDIFARLTEAVGSMSFSDGVLTLFSCANDSLDSENLDNYFASHDEAVNHLGLGADGHTLYAYDCENNTNGNGINLAAASGADSINYGRYLSLSADGKTITLYDQHNHYLDSVTLP